MHLCVLVSLYVCVYVCACTHVYMPQYPCSFDGKAWLKTLCSVSPNADVTVVICHSAVPG